jgi:predicted component of type VI protein secretion system
MSKIKYTTSDGILGEIELNGERLSFGRSPDCDVCLSDPSISGNHGYFEKQGNTWFFNDTGSTNGTKVDGQRVDRVELTKGLAFRFGTVKCTFHDESAAAAPSMAGFAKTVKVKLGSDIGQPPAATPPVAVHHSIPSAAPLVPMAPTSLISSQQLNQPQEESSPAPRNFPTPAATPNRPVVTRSSSSRSGGGGRQFGPKVAVKDSTQSALTAAASIAILVSAAIMFLLTRMQ